MELTAINPVSWSIQLGLDQAQLIEGHHRLLVCSAHDAMDADGNTQHPGDMAAQLGLTLDNLEAVLTGGPRRSAQSPMTNITADSLQQPLPICEVD